MLSSYVTFTVSPTGGLASAAGGSIAIMLPSGTDTSHFTSSTVQDNTINADVGSCVPAGLTITCTLFSGHSIAANDSITITLNGIVNPSTPSTTEVLKVSTTSDTTPAPSSDYSVVAGHSLSNLTVDNTVPSSAAGALTSYLVSFTVSPTGGLSSASGSQVTITLPSGTDTSHFTSSTVQDNTTNANVGACVPAGPTITCSLFSGHSIAANDSITITLNGITNPTTVATNVTLTAKTTSDLPTITSSPYATTTGHSLSNLTVDNTVPSSAAGALTSYLVSFTVSPTGGLSSASGSQVTITLPSGTDTSHFTSSTVQDNTTNANVGACVPAGPTITCSLFSGHSIAANDSITITLNGITNPTTVATNLTLTAKTTSDLPTITSSPYATTTGHSLSNLTVDNTVPSSAAGALTSYLVSFTVSPTGGLSSASGSQVTITLPSGTDTSHFTSSTVQDNTTNANVGACVPAGPTITCSLFSGHSIAANDSITITLNGITNPTTVATNLTLTAKTTSDLPTITSSPYATTTGHSLSKLTVDNTVPSSAAGALTSYLVSFTVSPTGGLSSASGSQVTITLPSGTDTSHFTSSTVQDNTTNANVGACVPAGPTITCSLFSGHSIAANDSITITLNGITNPTTVATNLTLTAKTTSDLPTITSSPYSVGTARAPMNTAPPTITGTPAVGQTLTCAPGTWSGTMPQTFAFQWLRDGTPIPVATMSTYAVVAADAGHTLTCQMTATNGCGQRDRRERRGRRPGRRRAGAGGATAAGGARPPAARRRPRRNRRPGRRRARRGPADGDDAPRGGDRDERRHAHDDRRPRRLAHHGALRVRAGPQPDRRRRRRGL